MGKIYHLFNGETYFLTLWIIKNIIKYSCKNHYFYIFLQSKKNINKYEILFKSLDFHDYSYIIQHKLSLKEKISLAKSKLLNFSLYMLKEKNNNSFYYLYMFLINYKHDNLILHVELSMIGRYSLRLLSKMPIKYVWVCWGNLPPIYPKKILKKQTFAYTIELFINKVYQIITLTEKDRYNIEKLFKIKKVEYIPYIADLFESKKYDRKDKRILVGNSGHYINTYIPILEFLNKIKGIENVEITFMVPYGCGEEHLKEFKSKCKEFNLKICFWEKIFSKDEYIKIMSNYSIYICGVERQSGLGAATTAFNLGLKVYLTGINYDYFSTNDFIVHNVKEINGIKTIKSLFEYQDNEIEWNQESLKKLFDIDAVSKKWDTMYDSLIKL